MSYRTSILCIAVEVLFLLLVVIVCIVVDELIYEQVTGIEPFKQGFFCDDESIMKPYTTKSSIKFEFADILKAGIVVSLAMILVVELELYVVKRRNADGLSTDDDENKFGKLSVPSWIIRMLHRMCIFGTGVALLLTFINVTKVFSGRLRPHFLAVCKPNTTLYNCSSGYITRDVCTGDPLLVKVARLSMPSVHTAFSFYFAVVVVLCLECLVSLRKYKIFRIVVQTAVVLLASGVSISRISQYLHHMSDVLVGGLIGIFAGWIVACKTMKLFTNEKQKSEYRQVPSEDEVRLTDKTLTRED